jgi:hypothetical protein
MTACKLERPYTFYSRKPLVVQPSELALSTDAGVLLARQAEAEVQVCRGISECIPEWRAPNKIRHSLEQLVSQRVYQIVCGYEDANDSNQLRQTRCSKSPVSDCPLPNKSY